MAAPIAVLPKELARVTLSRKRPLHLRLDVAPWAVPYAVTLYLATTSEDDYTWYIGLYGTVLLGLLHILCFLCEVWFVKWYHYAQCTSVPLSSLHEADSVFVEPAPHAGKPLVVPLVRDADAVQSIAAVAPLVGSTTPAGMTLESLPVRRPLAAAVPKPATTATASAGDTADDADVLDASVQAHTSTPNPASAAARAGGAGATDASGPATGTIGAFLPALARSWLRFEYQSTAYELVRLDDQLHGGEGVAGSGGGKGGTGALALAWDRVDCPDNAPLAGYAPAAWRGWGSRASLEALAAQGDRAVAAAASAGAAAGARATALASAALSRMGYALSLARYGRNDMSLPTPAFLPLFIEHALAPFFVFQVFCVLLWMLDEYWYYSLFTLATLTGMEVMMVFQQIQQKKNLASMRPTAPPVYVFCGGRWSDVPVAPDSLVPGDVIALSAVVPRGAAAQPQQQQQSQQQAMMAGRPGAVGRPPAAAAAPPTAIVPADCVLVRGTVVANEAMLTGESSPLMKEALPRSTATATTAVAAGGKGASLTASERLNAFLAEGSRSHSRHVAFAGTTILQASYAAAEEEEGGDDDASGSGTAAAGSIPPPPDGAAVAVVVRTGFNTSQGQLMRTITHGAGRVTVGSWEALAFILILLCFAIGASAYVLRHGWNDPRPPFNDRWKLILHCILIITSVVPPELPIELSLAVNTSMAALARRGIFCTEPFRLVYGGYVDTACFDKTGTLTSDELDVTGVVVMAATGSGGTTLQLVSPSPSAHHDAGAAGTASAGAAIDASASVLSPSPPSSLPLDSLLVMAGCHSLTAILNPQAENLKSQLQAAQATARTQTLTPAQRQACANMTAQLSMLPPVLMVGDSLERAALSSIGWAAALPQAAAGGAGAGGGTVVFPLPPPLPPAPASAAAADAAAPPAAAAAPPAMPTVALASPPVHIRVLKRWAFSSEAKRMTALVAVVHTPPHDAVNSQMQQTLAQQWQQQQQQATGGAGQPAASSGVSGASSPSAAAHLAAYSSTVRSFYNALSDRFASAGYARGTTTYLLVSKGAPEVLEPPLPRGAPAETQASQQQYRRTHGAITNTGARVIALALRNLSPKQICAVAATGELPPSSGSAATANAEREAAAASYSMAAGSAVPPVLLRKALSKLHRSQCEDNAQLAFSGFLVTCSPLKTDTLRTVKELTHAKTRVVMITGDAPLTAIAVARQTGIVAPSSSSAAGGDSGQSAWILEVVPAGERPPADAPSSGAASALATKLRWCVVPLPALTGAQQAAADASASSAVAPADNGGDKDALLRARDAAQAASARAAVTAALAEVSAAGGASSAASFRESRYAPFVPAASVVAQLQQGGGGAAAAGDGEPGPNAVVCVTGPALTVLHNVANCHADALAALGVRFSSTGDAGDLPLLCRALMRWCSSTSAVFARMSPQNKESVVLVINNSHTPLHQAHSEATALELRGSEAAAGDPAGPLAALARSTGGRGGSSRPHFTLMCGDGTNDVGALKRSHVGVSIVSNAALERRYDIMRLQEQMTKRNAGAAALAQLDREIATLRARNWGEDFIQAMYSRKHAAIMAKHFSASGAAASAATELDGDDEEELAALLKADKGAADEAEGEGGSDGAPGARVAPAEPRPEPQTPQEKRAAVEAELKERMAQLKRELTSGGGTDSPLGGAGTVALGDASIASPFTSKMPSPVAVLDILRQGRCALVTTHQVYRILSVNSLTLSYVLSVLYLHGLKTGDTQATVAGLGITVLFMACSFAKPLKRLAPVRPHTSVFNRHLVLSVTGQFIIHLACLMAAVAMARPYIVDDALPTAAANATELAAGLGGFDAGDEIAALAAAAATPVPPVAVPSFDELDEFGAPMVPSAIAGFAGAAGSVLAEALASSSAAAAAAVHDPSSAFVDHSVDRAAAALAAQAGTATEDEKQSTFQPNVLNTLIFLLSTTQQAVTFLVNYTGAPFMQPLGENKFLLYGSSAVYAVCLLAATGLSSDLSYWLQLVELPSGSMQMALVGLILTDAIATISWEGTLRRIFGVGQQV